MPATTTVALPTESEIMHTEKSVDGGVRDGNGQMPAGGLRQSGTTHRRVAVQPDRPLLPTGFHFASLTSGLGVKGLGQAPGSVADGMTYRCHPGEDHDRADMVWVSFTEHLHCVRSAGRADGKGGGSPVGRHAPSCHAAWLCRYIQPLRYCNGCFAACRCASSACRECPATPQSAPRWSTPAPTSAQLAAGRLGDSSGWSWRPLEGEAAGQ
jgi:hypothetical protein